MFELSRISKVFALISFFTQCHVTVSIHQMNVVKRMDIATCLAKFDVKNDMIIKTAESRKLGAKFLDSADALTKTECLHLCCETESCDVFVFEEKGQGECFLFHCGPAQDFRCKFSKHTNYTSAVLSVEKKVSPPALSSKKSNNLPTLPMSQNEIELKSLKGKSSDSVNIKISPDATAATIPTTIKAITAAIKNSTSHCGRFQFQCHSGDCIAIYNACDGIEQCDDGSDEGPECRSITRTPEATQNKQPADGRVQLISSSLQTNGKNVMGRNREDPLTAPQWPNLNQSPDLIGIQQYSDDGSKTGFGHNGGLHITENVQQIPQVQSDLQRQPFSANSKDAYHTWSSAGDPSLVPNWQQQMPEFPMKPLEYQLQKQPSFNHYQTDLVPKNVDVPDQTQLKNQQQYNWPIIEPNLPNVPNLLNENHPNHNNEEILPEKDAIGVIKDVPVLDRKKDGKNLLIQGKNDPKSTEDSDYNNEDEDETTTEPPKKKKKHRKVNKLTKQISDEPLAVQQKNVIHSGLQAEFLDHDGEADRPGGAVVSLALGIFITIGLIMVISCRKTTVRRVRRGKGYAHDADFLVNGMYL